MRYIRGGQVMVCPITLLAAIWLLANPPVGWAQTKERVTLKNTWVHTPIVAPVFLGLEKGYFSAEEIDLDWQDGRGSAKRP